MKKGYTSNFEKLIVWLTLRLPIIILLAFMLYNTGEAYEENNYPYPVSVQDQVVETRMLYNPACLAATRASGRVETAVLDPQKLEEPGRFDKCIKSGIQKIPVQLRVYHNVSDTPNYTMATTPWKDGSQQIDNPRRHEYVVNVKGEGLATAEFRYK